MLAAGQRGHALVVLDLARQVGSGSVSGELMARCDQVLVVTPATVGGVASTLRLVTSMADLSRLRLVARRGPVSARDLTSATGVALAFELPEQRGLAESVDLGLGPVRHRRTPLGRAVAEFLAEVA